MLNNLLKTLSVIFLVVMFTATGFAQSSANYTFATDATGSLTADMNSNPIDMTTGTTTVLAAGVDDTRSNLTNIGFDFIFMGGFVSNYSLTDNGIIQLGGNTVGASTYLISANTTLRLLAPYANDLRVGSDGKVHAKLFGSAPNRVYVIEYQNISLRYPGAAAPGGGTWQVRLYEATGAIEYVYGAMATNAATQTAVNLGFGINTTANSFLTIDATHTANTSGTFATFTPTASSTVAHLHSTEDGSRRYYRFNPPAAPLAPTALNFTAVSALGMTLNWTDNATTETGYLVYRSTDAVNYTLVATLAADAVTSVQTGLSPSTTYFWRVFAVNEGQSSSALSGSQATNPPGAITSIATGNWSSTSTWSGGVVPGAGDAVTIANGHVVTIDVAATAISLTVNGTLEFEDATARTLTVSFDVTIANGGVFQTAATGTVTTHVLSLAGNLVNNGTLDFSTNTNTAGATLTFTGTNNSSVTGTGAVTDLRALTMSKSARAVEVEFNVSNFSVRGASTAANGANFALLTSAVGTGTLKFSGTNAFDGTLYAGAYTIPSTMGLWINNPNFTANAFNGSITITGLFRMSAGTFNIGTASGNSMAFSSGSVISVEGGSIISVGRFGVATSSNAITYTQTGGNIRVGTIAHVSTTLASYDLGTSTSSVISVSGGTVVIELASTAASGPRDYRFQSGLGIGSVSGGTVIFGNANSGAAKTFNAMGVFPTLIIDNTTAGHSLVLGAPVTYNNISRDITINSGCTFNIGNNVFLFSGVTLTNNGTFIANGASSNFVWFESGMLRPSDNPELNSVSGNMVSLFADAASYDEFMKTWNETDMNIEAGPQTWTGSGTVTAPFTNFAVQNSNGVILNSGISNIVCRNIRLFIGGVTNSNKLTLGLNDATVSVIQIGNGGTGTPLAAGSFDLAPVFDLGTGGQTLFYGRMTANRTTGVEVNPSRTLISLAYDDSTTGRTLTISGGGLSVGTLNVTTGLINTSSSNLITVTGTTAASIVGGSATAFVNGPLVRTFPASLLTGSVYNYPVGKGSYRPLAVVDAVTTADGPVTIQAEVFDANSGGTAGTGMLSLNTNRYWSANVVSGGANLTSTKVRLTEDPLNATDGIAKSATLNGTYDLVSSTVPGAGVITSDDMTSLSFFNIGERFTGPPNPTGVTATAVSTSQINIAFTPNGATNNVVIVWNNTGVFTAPAGAPVVGDPLAGGTVLSNGTTSPVNHTGLTSATGYYYKAFSYDGAYSLGVDVNASTFGSVPYAQGFEGVFPPSGWLNYGDKLWTTGSEAHSGLKAARVVYTPAGTANLQTMPFVLPAAPSRIKFWWKDDDITTLLKGGEGPEVAAHDTTWFEISTDGGSNWTVLSLLSAPSNQSAYVELVQNLTAYANQTVSFRWRDWSDGTLSAWGVGLDDITLELIPQCTEPSALTATSITTNSALLGWTENGTATAWDIEYGVTPFVPTGTPTLSGVTNPYNLTGLSGSTGYAYYVRAACGVGDNSPWVGPYNFTTLCDVVLAPWNQDFEAATFPPTCWSKSTTPTWDRSVLASGYGVGTGSARANFYGISSATPFHLTSFSFDASSLGVARLKFDYAYATYTGGEVDQLDIYYSTDNGSTFTLLLAMPGGFSGPLNTGGSTSSSFVPTASQWATQTISLPVGTNMVRFMAISDFGNNLYVDNIVVEAAPSNDIGVVAFVEGTGSMLKTISNTGLSRELASNEDLENGSKSIDKNITISVNTTENSLLTEAAPVNFTVSVQNFGSSTENSFQVGWMVNGVLQTSVSNTAPLLPGETALITLTLNSPTGGLNTARAWTILAGDANPANDSSSTITFYVVPDNVVFGQYFEDPTFPPAGWLTVNADGGGTSGPWFAGNPSVFSAFEGSGYAAANYQGANGLYIDEWLISPNTGGLTEASDSLTFWMRSPDGSIWPDSVQILVSTTGTELVDFTTLLDFIEVPVGEWTRFSYPLPTAASRYIAFRYLIYDANTNSNYVGLDAVEIISGGGASTFSFSTSVNNGWNMVSVPGLHPTNQDVTTWWPGKDPSAGVFRFSGGYLPVTTTTPGQGYWMKHVGANTYNYSGIQIVAHDPIAGATGWNLIGGYELNVLTANITTTPGGLQTGSVFQYGSGYTVATNLVPGYGYWVKLTAPGSINIPNALAKGLAKNEVNTSDWGKIIITDKSGKSYTLYTVKGEVNLNDFELPPAPPTGMFDVRFGSGRYAEELSAVNQSIELNSLEYPVTVRVENADIRLQDGTGNGLNERLKSGEEVVISNSAINKLMVSGDVIPATYSLDQNYPNPFNPSTKIEFSIPEDVNNVTLTIYNALGQRVAELVNSKMEAGKYSYVWNASDVATGLYIYELRTDKFVSVKKMMLLK
jgi:hypothetical protein